MVWKFIMVFAGGGLGCLCRYFVSLIFSTGQTRFHALPIHTLIANFIGCLCIGIFAAWFAKQPSELWKLFLVSGFCGGFTTFSTFSAECLEFLRCGNYGMALIYMGLSLFTIIDNVSAKTSRYYEKIGLLEPFERDGT